jgi:uncharacterized membrane protein
MESHTPLPVKGHHVYQRHFDRLVMLSDGVFAIAMTLSAVELRPDPKPGESLLHAWGAPLLTYFVSFAIISGVWTRHRRALAHLRYVDTPMTAITLLLLSLVALMPVVIRGLLDGAIGTSYLGLLVYSLAMMANYACLAVGWGYAAFIGKLAPDVPRLRAWGWLLQEFFVMILFGAVALYSVGWKVPAAMIAVAGVVMRIVSIRLISKAEAVESASPPSIPARTVTPHEDGNPGQ